MPQSKSKPAKGKRGRHSTAEDFGIEISSPERVIFPDLKLTKKDLAETKDLTAQHPDVARQLTAALHAWEKEVGA